MLIGLSDPAGGSGSADFTISNVDFTELAADSPGRNGCHDSRRNGRGARFIINRDFFVDLDIVATTSVGTLDLQIDLLNSTTNTVVSANTGAAGVMEMLTTTISNGWVCGGCA